MSRLDEIIELCNRGLMAQDVQQGMIKDLAEILRDMAKPEPNPKAEKVKKEPKAEVKKVRKSKKQ